MTTEKHCLLLSGPIEGKSVFDLPGIGAVYGSRLMEAGYSTAEQVLNQYLNMNGDSTKFTSWLNGVCGANSRWSHLCFIALRDYSDIKEEFHNGNKCPKIPEQTQSHDEEIKELREQIMKQKESYSKLVQNNDKLVRINAELNQQKQNDEDAIELVQKQLMVQKVLNQKLATKYDDVVNRNEELQQMLQNNVKDMHSKMETYIQLLEQLTKRQKKHKQRKRDRECKRYQHLMKHCNLLTNQHEKLKVQYEKASKELAILKLSPKQLRGILEWIGTWSFTQQWLLYFFCFVLFNFILTLFQRKIDLHNT